MQSQMISSVLLWVLPTFAVNYYILLGLSPVDALSVFNQAVGNEEYHTISAAATTMEDATKFARELCENKLAALVSIHESISSYMWKDNFVQEKQYVLSILTHESKRQLVGDYIRKNHHHVEPGLFSYKIAGFSKSFLDWVNEMLEFNGTNATGSL